jgi:hypothetical protein
MFCAFFSTGDILPLMLRLSGISSLQDSYESRMSVVPRWPDECPKALFVLLTRDFDLGLGPAQN